MGKIDDLTGKRFGHLTVLRRDEEFNGKPRWLCQCDCGNKKIVSSDSLRRGRVKSCGCYRGKFIGAIAQRGTNEYRVENGRVFVKLPNTDREMITDQDIWEKAKKYHWCFNCHYYAIGWINELKRQVMFHVFAFPDCPYGMVHDHIDGNGLNNTRENIRFIYQNDNCKNRSLSSNNRSGCSGVSWSKDKRKWRACITINRKNIHLGYFSDKEEAISARQQAESKYFGEFRRK